METLQYHTQNSSNSELWETVLWDKHQDVDSFLVKNIDYYDKVLKYIQQQASIELEYCKQTVRLIDKFSIKVPNKGVGIKIDRHNASNIENYSSTFEYAFQNLLETIKMMAKQHEALSETTMANIIRKSNTSDIKLKQKRINKDIKLKQKYLIEKAKTVDSLEKMYKESCIKCINLQEKHRVKDEDDHVTRAEINKALSAFRIQQNEVEKKKQEYCKELTDFNDRQYKFYNNESPILFNEYQCLHTSIAESLSSDFKSLLNMIREYKTGEVVNMALVNGSKSAEKINFSTDQQNFTNQIKSGFPRPGHELDKEYKDYGEAMSKGMSGIQNLSTNKERKINFKIINDPFPDKQPEQKRRLLTDKINKTKEELATKDRELKGLHTLADSYSSSGNSLGDPKLIQPDIINCEKKIQSLAIMLQNDEAILKQIEQMLLKIQKLDTSPGSSLASANTSKTSLTSPKNDNSNLRSNSSSNSETSLEKSPKREKVGLKTKVSGIMSRWNKNVVEKNKNMTNNAYEHTSASSTNTPEKPKSNRNSGAGEFLTNNNPVKLDNNRDNETNLNFKKVLFSFDGEPDDHTISVKAGDTVILLDAGDDGWSTVKLLDSDLEGFVPTDYISS